MGSKYFVTFWDYVGLLAMALRAWTLLKPKFEQHMKCLSCMIGKSTLEDLPKLEDSSTEPLYQVNMGSFSSSVTSIEGYKYAIVFC
jgi:hypothetical protein